MSAFAQTRLGAKPQNKQILRMLSSLAKQDKQKNILYQDSVLYQVKVCHLGFSKMVSLYFFRLFQKF